MTGVIWRLITLKILSTPYGPYPSVFTNRVIIVGKYKFRSSCEIYVQ
jgi:hypothetical protein